MTLKLITGPTAEPVTLAEAKAHLRVDDTAEDALIGVLIQAAREQAEHQIGRPLMPQTWELVIDAFPAVEIDLQKAQVSSVVSVVYVDAAGLDVTLDASAYTADLEGATGWVLPAVGTAWPATLDTANAVRVRFVCGYANAAAVPAAIRSWILLRIGTLYKMREEIYTGTIVQDLPGGYADRLLDRFKVYQ